MSRRATGMGLLYIVYWGVAEPLGQSLVLPVVRALARRGLRVTLISFEKPRDLAQAEQFAALRGQLLGLGVCWTPLTYHQGPGLLAKFFDVAAGLAVGLIACWRRPQHIVHGRTFFGGLMAWLLCAVVRSPFIYHNEGFWHDQQVEGGFWRPGSLVYRVSRWLDTLMLRHARAVIVLARRALPLVRTLLGRRKVPVAVVPSCVDTAAFVPQEGARPPRGWGLVYVGSLGGRYPVEPLGRFLNALVALTPGCRLRILSHSDHRVIGRGLAGTGVDRARWEAGFVPHAQVGSVISEARAGLFFLRAGIGALTCSPTKVGEYWACGVPVVMNPGIGDVDDIIQERRVGVLVAADTAEEHTRAAHALVELWRDPELPARCRQAARDYYDLAHFLPEQLALYRRLTPAVQAHGQ